MLTSRRKVVQAKTIFMLLVIFCHIHYVACCSRCCKKIFRKDSSLTVLQAYHSQSHGTGAISVAGMESGASHVKRPLSGEHEEHRKYGIAAQNLPGTVDEPSRNALTDVKLTPVMFGSDHKNSQSSTPPECAYGLTIKTSNGETI